MYCARMILLRIDANQPPHKQSEVALLGSAEFTWLGDYTNAATLLFEIFPRFCTVVAPEDSAAEDRGCVDV